MLTSHLITKRSISSVIYSGAKTGAEHSREYDRNKKMCINKSIIKCDSEHIFYITNSFTGRHKYSGVVATMM